MAGSSKSSSSSPWSTHETPTEPLEPSSKTGHEGGLFLYPSRLNMWVDLVVGRFLCNRIPGVANGEVLGMSGNEGRVCHFKDGTFLIFHFVDFNPPLQRTPVSFYSSFRSSSLSEGYVIRLSPYNSFRIQ